MKPKQIILRLPNWIGDLVMATPILHDIKEAFPDARITVMCRKPLGELLKHDPNIDELLHFSKPQKLKRREERRDIIEKIRKGNYDLGILLTNSFSSAWYFWRGHVKKRLGYRGNFRSFLLSHPVSYSKEKEEQHLVLTYKELLKPLGIKISKTLPKLTVTESERKNCLEMLERFDVKQAGPLVGINPGAAYGSAKCWLPQRFRDVASRLLQVDPKLRILFFGDQSQAKLIKSICKDFPSRVVNLAGLTTMRELMALIERLDAFLTNDSGPMHIAAALGTPLVALFGSTSEILTGPYKCGVVIHKHVSCSPCFKRTCPIDFRCMKSIESKEVYASLMKLLEEKLKSE